MTNHDMVKPTAGNPERTPSGQGPNTTPLPPMPADGDSCTPTTEEEPIDSPQPNRSAERQPPADGEIGLSTKR